MLTKIDFNNGQIVRRDYLIEVQKGTSFSESPRADFYGEPTEAEHGNWKIGSRDKIKDWEVAAPNSEPQTSLGRLVYDGMVLGYDDTPGFEQVIFGPPRLVELPDGYGVWVEGGSAILSNGEKISWDRQTVQLVSNEQVNYIYLSEAYALQLMQASLPVTLSIGTSLPSITVPHIPLAKLTLNANSDGLLLETDGDPGSVVGYGYVDLRPSTHIGNLNTYARNLTNTGLLTNSTQIEVWRRAIVDTSNGSLVITLPSNPENSDRVAIADISGTFDRYPVILRVPDDVDYKINGSVDDWIINIRDSHLELYYNEDTNQWKFEESPGGDCNPVMGSFLSCGGKEYIGEKPPEECPDGRNIPAPYPYPSEGVYEYELNTGKCYKKYNDSVAIYANGQGGLITVLSAPRCEMPTAGGRYASNKEVRNIIYVDPSIGDDGLDNTGFSADRPFRSPERAIIEATRESRRSGPYNDRYDRIVIEMAPGDYYVDNSPGSGNTTSITSETGLIQRVSTGFRIQTSVQGDRKTVIQIDSSNANADYPPTPISLGRILYSESGGVGNIAKLEKVAPSSPLWKVTLEYVKGQFNRDDEIFYDNLSVVNPIGGGIIVPRGISINGVDLRKVRVRPMYVPTLSAGQDDPQLKTSIWKVTGGSYVSLQTFTDNLQFARTHNTVTTVTFASRVELAGDQNTTSYYAKLNALFNQYDGWDGEVLEYLGSESTIVAPVPPSYQFRQEDNEENQTGYPAGDAREDAPVSYPGPTRLKYSGDPSQTVYNLPDVNSTRSSSPYIFNCSVRSIFGMNGLHADGALVDGLKSMVTANFTQVSLQTDPNCYDPNTYYADPPANETQGGVKRFKESAADRFKYRSLGFRGSNDAVIQIVSCFVIGNSDHFVADSGGDLSITNSCSDFGDVSLKAVGYKERSFSQDEGAPSGEYGGTKVLEIIPPKPLTYSQPEPTIENVDINTGFTVDYLETLNYILANKGANDSMPAEYRIYLNNDSDSPFTLQNPPSADLMGYGQYAYTKLSPSNQYILTGGDIHIERKRLYISGFDESANSITFISNIIVPGEGSPGFDSLDSRSKIFVWDASLNKWYVKVNTGNIAEDAQPNAEGFLNKKLDYAFRFKLISQPNTEQTNLARLDFIFSGSAVRTIRGIDNRSNDERVYRIVLDGFKKTSGIRRPQPYYILEKQAGVAGGQLNLGSALGDNPLTVTSIRPYAEALGISTTNPNYANYDGQYVTYLTFSDDARRVFENNLYPVQDFDEPELTEDPSNSITKTALVAMLSRPGVWFSAPIAPNYNKITIKTSSGVVTPGIRIGLRRPSIIRASGHTWEWTGYLNYDTALPAFQNNPLEEKFALAKIIDEERGGRVYATGMNEEGNYYIGTTVFDLRSGEQFSIPFKNDQADNAVSNQVFSNVAIRNSLLMKDDSSIIFGKNTTLFFNNTTRFRSLTTGDISVTGGGPLPGVYATTERAGIVQLAKRSDIRGAAGSAQGVANNVVVTAADLAAELTSRFNSAVQEGVGIVVGTNSVDLPGGDPNDPADNVTQFTVSVDPTYGGFVPVGGIIMWSGSIFDLENDPELSAKWRLCNGENGTPPLQDRFILAAGPDFSPGEFAGSRNAVVVAHTHSFSGTTGNDSPDHTHRYEKAEYGGTADSNDSGRVSRGTDPASTAGASNRHQHSFSGTTVSSGVSGLNANMPPYYVLAYIMRVA